MKLNFGVRLLSTGSYVVGKWVIIGLIGIFLYKNGLWNDWFLVVSPMIGFTAVLVRNKRTQGPGFEKYFKQALEKRFPLNSSEMTKEMDARFKVLALDTRFASRSSNPIDRRLDFAAYFLALIQTLEKGNHSYDEIKTICLEVTYDYVHPKNAIQKWLKRLPAKIIGLKIVKPILTALNKKVMKKGNEAGFRAQVITDESETYGLGYGVDILECGICKLFQKHDAGKYASILCEVDKMTSKLAGLVLIRNGTIATGAEKCDFRFKKISAH
ncbi:MAG TPA: L-2-amino-thiazoline-4-carboxylic acid hydrolase [Chryseolinea sp.]